MEKTTAAALAQEAIHLIRTLALVGRNGTMRLHSNKLYFHALCELCGMPPPGLTMSQLAEAMLTSPQQLSRLISSMEEKGLVKREHNCLNRRQVYVSALPAGQLELDNIIVEVQKWIADELEIFSEQELGQLHDCFAFVQRLLKKGLLTHNIENPSLQEELS